MVNIRSLFKQKNDDFSEIKTLETPLHVRLCESNLFETQDDVNENFGDLVGFVREWLQDQGFSREEAIMDFMLEQKNGSMRKDGQTPAALHEISQLIFFASCVEDNIQCEDPAGVIATILCHDLKEDFKIPAQQLNDRLFIHGHQQNKAMHTLLLDYNTISYHNGDKEKPNYKNKHAYSLALRERINPGTAKIVDNIHNAATAIGGLDNKNAAGYGARIALHLNEYINAMCNNHPQNAELFRTLQKIAGKTVQINNHLFFNDTGQPLRLTNEDYPIKGFDLPRGLHPYNIARDRVIAARPELAPMGYTFPQNSSKNSDDSPTYDL